MTRRGVGNVLLGILDGDVPPGSLNPDSILDQKTRHFLHARSSLGNNRDLKIRGLGARTATGVDEED